MSDYTKLLLNNDNIKLLSAAFGAKLNKTIKPVELHSLILHIKKIKPSFIHAKYIEYKKDMQKLNDKIITDYIKAVKSRQVPLDNIEEYNTKVINQESFNNRRVESFGGLEEMSLYDITKMLNYKSLRRESQMLIDTRYQNLSNTDRTRFAFSLSSDTVIKSKEYGMIALPTKVKNLIEIEIPEIYIPSRPLSDNYYKKITLSILEFSQGVSTHENMEYHFMFNYESTDKKNIIKLTPINKKYSFPNPIPSIDGGFTLRFGSPFTPIDFDIDRQYCLPIDYTNTEGTIVFSNPHKLESGDLIYITDFRTNSPAADLELTTLINNPQGNYCSRVDDTTITLDSVDFSKIKNPITDLTVSVYFGSKRIIIPMTLRYLV